VREKLLYGVALQHLEHQLSALREFEAAAALAPNDPEPQVAAAVGMFDKAQPSRTFSRLGPLAKRFPHSQTVRFHLGLCLLWLGSVKEAKRQLRLAQAAGPRTALGIQSARFLDQLAGVGTG
jgi:predicted Zn-dependent protease